MTDHNPDAGKKVCCAWCGTDAPFSYCPKDGCIGQMLFEEAQEAILAQRRKDFEAGHLQEACGPSMTFDEYLVRTRK